MKIKILLSHFFSPENFKGQHTRQFLTYVLSVSGTMVAGFFLVLILVRILPAEVYGGLVLTKILLLVVTSLAGMGLSQSVVRWCGLKERDDHILGSALSGTFFTALPASIILITVIWAFAVRLKLTLDIPLLLATFVMVFSYMLNNELVNWTRAQHQAGQHALVSTLRAVLQLLSITSGVLLMKNNSGYIFGLAAAELLLLAWLGFVYREKIIYHTKLIGEMLHYGWPHAFVITSGFSLNYADRYILSFITNNDSLVAYYDAASMVVISALALLVRPFNLFLFPAYVRRYEIEGRKATVALVNRAQQLFLIAGLGLSTFLVAFRETLMQLLFPAEYSSASSIFAAVAYGSVLNGVFLANVAGLYISKRTLIIAIIVIMAILVNLAANFLLIPVYGMNGAAYGIAISSFVQLILGHFFSRKFLPVKLPIGIIISGALWLGFLSWIIP